jgi:exopolysaccharide biosynthesis polyprenyl glycosylphosphotransferase
VAVTIILRYPPAVVRGDVGWLADLAVPAAFVVAWLFFLAAGGTRDRDLIGAGVAEYQRVALASLYTFGLAAIVSYAAKAELPRSLFLTTLPLGIALLWAGRWSARKWRWARHADGAFLTPSVAVVAPEGLAGLAADWRAFAQAGYNIRALCLVGPEPATLPDRLEGLERLGLDDIVRRAQSPDQAVIVVGGLSRDDLHHFAWRLENTPVELLVQTQFTDVGGSRIKLQTVEGLGLAHVQLPVFSGWQFVLKRALDIVCSAVLLVVLSPLFLVVAALIKREDGGPVFFHQARGGLNGRLFTMHKFRTMVPDAEATMKRLVAEGKVRGLLFKLDDDPRITRVGRTLRRYSIDELPQLWSVLRGDMSLVGPRPQMTVEIAEYEPPQYRRFLVKPGVTGPWQISDRSQLSPSEAIRLDLRYVENWSLSGDIVILIKTLWVALKGHNQ